MNKGISAVNEIRNYVKGLQNSLTESSENEKKLKSQENDLKNIDEEMMKVFLFY